MKWLGVLTALLLAVSCGPGQPAYLDGVKALSDDRAHPLYLQVLPLVNKPGDLTPDQLMRTWKDFLGETPRPLRRDGIVTFVYYDFSHKLDQVFLEASFAPQRLEPMTRVGASSLFARVYAVPKPTHARYRYSDGTTPLPDPFHANLEPGGELWSPMVVEISADPSVQWVSGLSETVLEGQDLVLLLPPGYRRNLGATYPLVVVTGLEGRAWTESMEALMREGAMRPMIVVSLDAKTNLKNTLEDRVVPWVRSHYRASPLASELVLVGWGASAKAVQDAAAARPDFWTKTWTPLADQARGTEAWNTLAPPFFRTLFPVVTP